MAKAFALGVLAAAPGCVRLNRPESAATEALPARRAGDATRPTPAATPAPALLLQQQSYYYYFSGARALLHTLYQAI